MAAEASVYRSTNQTIVKETVTTIDLDTELFDVGPMHDPATNPSRLTVPAGEDGYYVVVAQAAWGNAAGTKALRAYLAKNGTIVARDLAGGNVTTGNVFNQIAVILSLAAADYLQLQVYQDGGTVDDFTLVGGNGYTFLQAIKVA